MAEVKLIATDYDDTLVGKSGSMVKSVKFQELLSKLRWSSETKWAIVTGRHLAALSSPLKQLSYRGLRPDYIIVSESYIYRLSSFGYLPVLKWNLSIWNHRRKIRKQIRKYLKSWVDEVSVRWPSSHQQSSGYAHLWYTFENEEIASEVAVYLEEQIKDIPKLLLFKNNHEIYMGVDFCCKGMALSKLCQIEKIELGQTFAIGDGQNDISMLDGSSAQLVACVGNACKAARETVENSGGYVAKEDHILGVVEAIEYFLEL